MLHAKLWYWPQDPRHSLTVYQVCKEAALQCWWPPQVRCENLLAMYQVQACIAGHFTSMQDSITAEERSAPCKCLCTSTTSWRVATLLRGPSIAEAMAPLRALVLPNSSITAFENAFKTWGDMNAWACWSAITIFMLDCVLHLLRHQGVIMQHEES